MGVGWAYGWSCTLECFFNFFWFLQRVHGLPWEAWIFAQCTQKRVLVVGVFLWVGLTRGGGGKFPPFYTQDHFQWLLFCMAVNRKHPFMVNDSSVNVAYWIGNAGMGKPNIGLDFTYYLCITWHRACAMQILSINMEILGPLSIYGTA